MYSEPKGGKLDRRRLARKLSVHIIAIDIEKTLRPKLSHY